VFTILIAEEGDRLLGYAVLTLDADGRRAYVADVLCLPGRIDAARALVREALVRARRAGAREALCRLPERHVYRAVLNDAGFILKRRKDDTAFRWTGGVPEEDVLFLLEKDAAIHITYGDTDMV
jgi:hypothetical protein